jgi:hypothetical protein
MAQYNPTNYYTTLGDYTNVYVDMGTVYVDLSYNQTIQGVKSFGTAPMTNYANAPYQIVNKQYIDDNFNPINYKVTMPVVNNLNGISNITGVGSNILVTSCTNTPNGFTKKSFTPFQNFTTIQRKMINTQIDAPANQDTYYTFGVSKPSMWLAGGTSLVNGNSLAYSYDGFNWTGIPSTDVSGVRALAYNGSIWVAGCGGYSTPALDIYGGGAARTTLAYSYNGFNWTPNYYANNIFTQSVNGLAWNGLIFVAAGQGGNSLGYSYDGIRWTGAQTQIFTGFATSVAWNGTLWVATGTGGPSVCYSYNGIVWLQGMAANSPFGYNTGNCVAYDGVRWLAGGSGNPNFAVSFNGQAWNVMAQQTGITNSVLGLAWNGIMWIAVGKGSNTIVYSYDGCNWISVMGNGGIFNAGSAYVGGRCVAWNGYMWVAGGGQSNGAGSTLAYSYNGILWTALGAGVFSGACNAIIWCGRRENIIYYPQNRTLLLGGTTGGGPTIQYSNNYHPYQGNTATTGTATVNLDYATGGYITGVSWVEQAQASSNTIFSQANGAAWNGYKWIAVGQAASTVYGYGNTMAFSTIIGNTNIGNAGNIWIGMQNRIFSVSGMNIAYNGNIWAAVGQGGNSIAWSSDGNSWFGLGTGIFSNYGQTIAWNGSYWLAGGSGAGNTMAFSYDGITWSGLGNGIFNIQCNGLAWNGTIWVAVGYGAVNTMAYSSDGLSWNGLNKVSFTTQGNDVAVSSSSGLWVAVGGGGNTIVNSTDGVNWYKTTTASLFSTVCNSVTWNGKYWMASGVGTSHTNAWSYDAMNWTGLGTGLLTGSGQRAVWNQGLGSTYIKNNYLVKSNLNTTSNLTIFFGQKSTLYYSTNGIVWNSKVQPYNYDMVVGIAYNGKVWAATTNIATSLYAFIYSIDGINWIYSKTTIVDNLGPVYTNGTVFVAGSTIGNYQYFSYDAINWTVGYNQSMTTILDVFVWNNNNHFWIGMGGSGAYSTSGAVTTNSVAYSVDGVGWFNMPNCNLNNFVCRSLAWNGIQFVAVGAPSVTGNPVPGTSLTGSYASLWASNDGQRWYCGILSNPVTNVALSSLISGDVFSNTGTGYTQKSNSGRGVAWNGRLWVACGTGLQNGCNNSVVYSYDGFIWFNQPFNTDPFGATGTANNIFWNGFMFVCNGLSSSGCSQLAYSYNGLTWFISPYNTNGTITLQNNSTSTFMSNSMSNINKVQLNLNGPNQSKTLDIVADNYYTTGYTKTTFFA